MIFENKTISDEQLTEKIDKALEIVREQDILEKEQNYTGFVKQQMNMAVKRIRASTREIPSHAPSDVDGIENMIGSSLFFVSAYVVYLQRKLNDAGIEY